MKVNFNTAINNNPAKAFNKPADYIACKKITLV